MVVLTCVFATEWPSVGSDKQDGVKCNVCACELDFAWKFLDAAAVSERAVTQNTV